MMEPLRVLQVFGKMDRGGAETIVMNLYRSIDRTKIQFDFMVHSEVEGDYDEEIRSLGGRIYTVPRYTGKNHFLYKKSWMSFLEEHTEYKIIHGHIRSTASIYLRLAKDYGLFTIAHSHSTSSGSGISSIVKDGLQYPIRYIADYLFACSENAGQWLYGKKACKRENFKIFNNAIDTKKFLYDERTRLNKRIELQLQDKFVIGHVGRFIDAKNHDVLIDIFKKVLNKKNDAVLLLVGDGELRESIEKKVKRLNLTDHVIFAGVRTDIPDLLQAMDVFLFPSLYEGLPVTLVEAQAAGLPCVISGKITQEVKVTNLVKVISLEKNSDFWANEILKYCGNFLRENKYNEIVESGYDIENVADWYMHFCIQQSKYSIK